MNFHEGFKKILCIFEIILVCPVTFKSPKMGDGEEMYKKLKPSFSSKFDFC